MHLKRKEMKATIRRRGKNFLGDSGEVAQSHDTNSCEEWSPVSPARAGATYKVRTAGAKGAHSSRRAPHTHTHQELSHRRST